MSANLIELKKFSTEVEEAQVQILFSTQRIKGIQNSFIKQIQENWGVTTLSHEEIRLKRNKSIIKVLKLILAEEYHIKNLKSTIEQNKDKCSMICAENMKLEAEITNTQQEITSLLVIQKAINNANVELKRNILKAQEEKQDIIDDLKNTQNKYENLWEESKARYESLPHVQKLLQAQQNVRDMTEKIRKLEIDEKDMIQQIQKKEEACRTIDRERIIKFAKYMVMERPKLLEEIKLKTAQIQEVQEQINNLKSKKQVNDDEHNEESQESNQRVSIMPRLQLDNYDVDSLNDMTRGDDFIHNSSYSVHSIIVIDPTKTTKKNKTPTMDNYFSTYFYQNISEANKIQNFEKKKLINILGDINNDENKANTSMIIEDISTDELQPTISADDTDAPQHIKKQANSQNKTNDTVENDEMEEIDVTASQSVGLLKPPTQFKDMPQKSQKEQVEPELDPVPISESQDSLKKQVTFDLSHIDVPHSDHVNDTSVADTTVTRNSQLDINDERFTEITNMTKKKYNLDLSPQFVYAKNDMTPKKPENQSVFTSKFFPKEKTQKETEKLDMEVVQNDQVEGANTTKSSTKEKPTIELDVDSSPKRVKKPEKSGFKSKFFPKEKTKKETEKLDMEVVQNDQVEGANLTKTSEIEPVPSASEFMFGVSTPMASSGIEEESINASEYDDDAVDFSYADPSFLLSPKDTSMQMDSQEIPSFIAGLQKTGTSFFENMGATNSKPDSAQKSGTSRFSFRFGNDDKKSNTSSFFNMFK